MFEVKPMEEMPVTRPRTKFPFEDMRNGDFFEVEDPDLMNSAKASAYTYGKNHGKKFQCKKINGVLHIQRTA